MRRPSPASTVIVSLLRGINLGPSRRIAMQALREVYESLGFSDVQTYVQSGNVVCRTTERNLSKLPARIGDAIEVKFGFRSAVVVRTTPEMRGVVAANPFASREDIEPGKFLVTFLSGEPAAGAAEKVRAIPADPEELRLVGRELYIYFPNGIGRSKLSMAAIEKAVGAAGTGRNWNTVRKLLEMAEAMEAAG